MSKTRGNKGARNRAGHKHKNKKTFRGRFAPLEDPEKYFPKFKKLKTKTSSSVIELFKKK